MNDPEGAAEALERAIALEPDRHTAYTQLFTARMQQKRPDLALAVAERMKTQFPDRISGDTLLGIAYLSTRDIDKAHEAFARAVEREPEDPAAAGKLVNILVIEVKKEEEQEALELAPEAAKDQLNRILNEPAPAKRTS